jgi:ATP-binding cassette subfamily B protein
MTPDEKKPDSGNATAVTRFVLGYLGRDALRVSGFVAGMFAHVVLTVASTRLIGIAVEHAGSDTGLGRLGLDLAAILGVLLAAICARWVSDRAINRHTAEAMAAIVASGFTKVQAFETSWHADNFAGATARKITRAAQGYDMVVSCCYFFFLPSILLVLVTAAVIAPESALAAAAMLAGSAVYFIVITWYNRTRVMPLMTAAFAHDSRITGELVDALGNNAAVKAWATERQEEARLRHIVGQWSAKLIAAWNGAVSSDQLQTGISAVILVAPIAIIVLQARWGLVDAGTVATVIGSGFVLRGWLGNIGRGVREAQNAVSEMTELVNLLGRICEAEQDRGLRSFTIGRGGIRFEAVGFRYAEAGAAVFEDLTVDIAPGQTVALVGPSGGGKSSFVKLLLGLYRPQQGRILIDGQDVAHCTRASIRQAIALVPQDPALFHRTIADNLAYGAGTSTRAQIHEAARRARLDTLIHSLPKGYETLVGERGIKPGHG